MKPPPHPIRHLKSRPGFTLVEVVFATGILAAMIVATSLLTVQAQNQTSQANIRHQAHTLAIAGMEMTRSLRDQHFERNQDWLQGDLGLTDDDLKYQEIGVDPPTAWPYYFDASVGQKTWKVYESHQNCNIPGNLVVTQVVITGTQLPGRCNGINIERDANVNVATNSLVEIIRVPQDNSVNPPIAEFHRYTTVRVYNAGVDMSAIPAAARPPCDLNCSYLETSMIDSITKQPLDLKSYANPPATAPPAVLVEVSVAWNGGINNQVEVVKTLLTNWQTER